MEILISFSDPASALWTAMFVVFVAAGLYDIFHKG